MDNAFKSDHAELLDNIAKRHGIIPQRNEVTLMQLTIYEYFLYKSQLADQQQLNHLNQSLEMTFHQLNHEMSNNLIKWSDSIDRKAELLIRVGLEENRDQIADAKKKFFADLESQIANQQVITSAAAEKIQKAAKLNYMVGAFLSVAVAVV
ncbi:hypothetical protein, partial [Shewanella sairae]|uniref:hypothetical protein n=2 Tax=Shewanella sairae TaxID=190310 RepID=UPI001C821FD6